MGNSMGKVLGHPLLLELQTFNHCPGKTVQKKCVTTIATHAALPKAIVNAMYDLQKSSIDRPILAGDAFGICEA